MSNKKAREIQVNSILGIGNSFHLSLLTIHLAVSYLDTVMQFPSKSEYKLIALCCLIVAGLIKIAKYDELDKNIPYLKDFQKNVNNEFNIKALKDCENEIIRKLNWNLKRTIPIHFIYFMISIGFIFKNDKILNKEITFEDLQKIEYNFNNLINITIKSPEMKKFSPFIIGISFIAALRAMSCLDLLWCPNLVSIYGLRLNEFSECLQIFLAFY